MNKREKLYIILKRNYERYLILKNWKVIVKKLACIVKKYIPDAEIYVFGSVPEGKFTAASDLDVLIIIISNQIPKKWRDRIEIELKIRDELNLDPDPLEVHLVTFEEATWHFNNLKIKAIEIKCDESYWESWITFKKSISFSKKCWRKPKSEEYNLAVFHAQQALQLYLKATLLKITGTYPEIHDLKELLSQIYSITGNEEVREFVRTFRKQLIDLDRAYIESRYGSRISERIEAEEYVMLVKKCIGLLRRVIEC